MPCVVTVPVQRTVHPASCVHALPLKMNVVKSPLCSHQFVPVQFGEPVPDIIGTAVVRGEKRELPVGTPQRDRETLRADAVVYRLQLEGDQWIEVIYQK